MSFGVATRIVVWWGEIRFSFSSTKHTNGWGISLSASLANGKLPTISTTSPRTRFDISTCVVHMSISFSFRNLCIQKCKYQHMWKVIYRNKTLRHAVFSGREDKKKKEILRVIKMRRKKRIAKLFCLHLEAAIFFFYDVRSINRTKMRRSIQLSDKRDDEQHKYLFANLQHFRSLFIACWKRKLIKIQSIPISVKKKKKSHAFHFDPSFLELRNQWNISWRDLKQFEWVWLKERFEGFDGALRGFDGLRGGLMSLT